MVGGNISDGEDGSAAHFVDWIERHSFEVIVFDMDCTMSTSHCGSGLPREKLSEYISNASNDFVKALRALCLISTTKSIKCAVATGSDPLEYDLPGQSKETHILGPDLAAAVVKHHCQDALPLFEVMVGYDDRLHNDNNSNTASTEQTTGSGNQAENRSGKRHHMRLIQKHYGVPFQRMVLFDDYEGSLANEDGWVGVKVDGNRGFRFADLHAFAPELNPADSV